MTVKRFLCYINKNDIMITKIYRQNISDEEFMIEQDTHKYLREYIETDEKGNEIIKKECNPDGSVEQKTVREFNAAGQIVKEQIYDQEELIENKSWEYDENGNVIKEIQYYIDGSCDITTVAYDENGNITGRKTIDDDGEAGGYEEITYSNGNIVKHAVFDEDGEVESEEINEWDDQNRLIKKEQLTLEGERETLEFEYNENGQLYREILFNEDGKIVERNTYTYGSNGMPEEIHEESTVKNNRTRVTYNDKNQVSLHEVFDVSDNLVNRVERHYNDQGNVTFSEVLISMPERGIRHHYQLLYEYE